MVEQRWRLHATDPLCDAAHPIGFDEVFTWHGAGATYPRWDNWVTNARGVRRSAAREYIRAPGCPMKHTIIGDDDLVTTFAQQRQLLLKHTADLLCADAGQSATQSAEREAKLSAILVTSLEELKVAEEELEERVGALATMRDELERRVLNAQQLFDLAPACLLVTDVYGSILEANRACLMLLKRDFDLLQRQPLARFIPPDERRGFREGLARIVGTDGVSDWRFLLIRPTDGPLMVSAAVNVCSALGPAGGSKLFWSLRVLDASDAAIGA
jgi:PAS domain-containing protein